VSAVKETLSEIFSRSQISILALVYFQHFKVFDFCQGSETMSLTFVLTFALQNHLIMVLSCGLLELCM